MEDLIQAKARTMFLYQGIFHVLRTQDQIVRASFLLPHGIMTGIMLDFNDKPLDSEISVHENYFVDVSYCAHENPSFFIHLADAKFYPNSDYRFYVSIKNIVLCLDKIIGFFIDPDFSH